MITLLYRDKRLIVTKHETIRQNDSRTVILKILVDTLSNYAVFDPHARISFLSPDNITGKICSVTLTKDENYSNYLSATLLLNKTLTQQIGELKVWLTFSAFNTEIQRQYYMTTNSVSLNILPIKHICDCIPDICDRDIIADMQAQIDELKAEKADDVELINGEIWAVSNGEKIGDPVSISSIDNNPEWEPITGSEEGGGEDDLSYLSKIVEKLQSQVDALQKGKADDVELIDGKIWAMSDGEKIGDPIPAEDIDNDDIIWESI